MISFFICASGAYNKELPVNAFKIKALGPQVCCSVVVFLAIHTTTKNTKIMIILRGSHTVANKTTITMLFTIVLYFFSQHAYAVN